MFDCMEALGMGPRQLYDITSRGACMLRKASPFFAGLDPFAWTGSASVQCKWLPVFCVSALSRFPSIKLQEIKEIKRKESLEEPDPEAEEPYRGRLCRLSDGRPCYRQLRQFAVERKERLHRFNMTGQACGGETAGSDSNLVVHRTGSLRPRIRKRQQRWLVTENSSWPRDALSLEQGRGRLAASEWMCEFCIVLCILASVGLRLVARTHCLENLGGRLAVLVLETPDEPNCPWPGPPSGPGSSCGGMIDGPVVRQLPSAEFILQSGEKQPSPQLL
ncbi:unnamed protein product [Lota lota]